MLGIDAARLFRQPHETTVHFDTDKLAQHALLQSMLHEVLRMHVTSLIARHVEDDVRLGDTQLPRGSMVLVVPWLQHRNREAWKSRAGIEHHDDVDLGEFWAERFLRHGASGPEFSVKGLSASFTPFGVGLHACPGRRFATRAILTIVATWVSAFEFAPLDSVGWGCNMALLDTRRRGRPR